MKTRRSTKRKVEAEDADGVEMAGAKQQQVDFSVKLTEAVTSGNISIVTESLQSGDFDSATLRKILKKAVESGQKRMVQLLLHHGVTAQHSMLHDAARLGFYDIVRLLINSGVSVNAKDSDGRTPLMLAIQHSCCSPLVSYLLNSCSAKPNIKDKAGKTALMMSVELWDYENVQILLQSKRCNLDIKDDEENTVHDLAKQNGSADLLQIMQDSLAFGGNPLIEAAARNNFELVRKLIQINPEWANQNSKKNLTPLAAVMGRGATCPSTKTRKCDRRIVMMLLKEKADVNTPHPVLGYTPLMLAARSRAKTITQFLLHRGAELDKRATKSYKETALMFAAESGRSEIVDLLLEAGADLTPRDTEGETAFHYAIRFEHKECAKSLLLKLDKLDEDMLGSYIWRHKNDSLMEVFVDEDVKARWHQLLDPVPAKILLTRAIDTKCYSLVSALMDFGVNVTYPCYDIFAAFQSLPLKEATKDIPMLRLMLDKGADVNASDSLSSTTLMEAAKEGNVDVVKVLLEYNVDMCRTTYSRCTALCKACKNEHEAVVTALLDAGMDVNYESEGGHSALFCALRAKSLNMTKLLVQRGASVNCKDCDGMSALMYALSFCPSMFAELLINHGADVQAEDKNGETPIFYAIRHSITLEEKTKLLLQKGADVNYVNPKDNTTPLVLAAQHCQVNILQLLMDYGAKASVNANPKNSALHVVIRNSTKADKLKILLDNGADPNNWETFTQSPLILALDGLREEFVRCLVKSGASVAYSNTTVQKQWNNYIAGLLRKPARLPQTPLNFIKLVQCLEPILEAGYPLNHIRLSLLCTFVLECIAANQQRIILLLMQSGHGPQLVSRGDVIASIPAAGSVIAGAKKLGKMTYACSAILSGSRETISLLAQTRFYNDTDVKLLQQVKVRSRVDALLQDWPTETISPPSELMPEKWSLFTWSTLAVNKAIGFGPIRESRIRALPIPQALKDTLLYKDIRLPEIERISTTTDSGSPQFENHGLDAMD